MKYFKLVKTYPGSPKLGALYCEQPCVRQGKQGYGECGKLAGVPLFDLQDYPEYWKAYKPRKNKIYKVLLVEHPSGIREIPQPHNIDKLLKCTKVVSIQRLSDSMVFKLGDVVYTHRETHESYTIDRIELWGKKEVIFYTREEGHGYVGGTQQCGINMGVCSNKDFLNKICLSGQDVIDYVNNNVGEVDKVDPRFIELLKSKQ